jgi:hypothetical protein
VPTDTPEAANVVDIIPFEDTPVTAPVNVIDAKPVITVTDPVIPLTLITGAIVRYPVSFTSWLTAVGIEIVISGPALPFTLVTASVMNPELFDN